MNDFLAVLVLYKISLEESLTFQSLKRSLLEADLELTLLIYDNSPVAHNYLSFFKSDNMDIYYTSDVNNSGLSIAYNQAYCLARKLDKSYLLLLDQDSCFPLAYCKVLVNSVFEFEKENLFVPLLVENNLLLSPCRFLFYKGRIWRKEQMGIVDIHDKSVFNSGICIKVSAYKVIGGYNELIPLDFSDHFFISQYKKIYSTFVVLPIRVSHSLSTFSLDKQKHISRFKSYCQGTKVYTIINKGFLYLLFWNLLRAIKLSVLFRDFVFIHILFKEYIVYGVKDK